MIFSKPPAWASATLASMRGYAHSDDLEPEPTWQSGSLTCQVCGNAHGNAQDSATPHINQTSSDCTPLLIRSIPGTERGEVQGVFSVSSGPTLDPVTWLCTITHLMTKMTHRLTNSLTIQGWMTHRLTDSLTVPWLIADGYQFAYWWTYQSPYQAIIRTISHTGSNLYI